MLEFKENCRFQGELSISGAELADRLDAAATQMKVRSEESMEKVTELQALLNINSKGVDQTQAIAKTALC